MRNCNSRQSYAGPFAAFREFDQLVNTALKEADRYAGPRVQRFPVDVYEHQDVLHIEADLPGYARDQIVVSLQDGTLTISAERPKREVPEEAAPIQDHVRERRQRKLERRFDIPATYDADNISAKLNDGVLHLTLPKREEVKPRSIEIE